MATSKEVVSSKGASTIAAEKGRYCPGGSILIALEETIDMDAYTREDAKKVLIYYFTEPGADTYNSPCVSVPYINFDVTPQHVEASLLKFGFRVRSDVLLAARMELNQQDSIPTMAESPWLWDDPVVKVYPDRGDPMIDLLVVRWLDLTGKEQFPNIAAEKWYQEFVKYRRREIERASMSASG